MLTGYEKQLDIAQKENIIVIEKYDMEETRFKGLYCDGTIALSKDMDTTIERSCILAEEMGHHYTTFGNITDQSKTMNVKQELRARMWAYNEKIGLMGIINAFEKRLTDFNEIAELLEVTPEFLFDALKCYKSKYSPHITLDNYIIFFEPNLSVAKIIDN